MTAKEIGYAIDGIKNESENKWINGNIWVQQLKQKIEEAKAYLNNLEADKYDDFADELRNQITVSENYKIYLIQILRRWEAIYLKN